MRIPAFLSFRSNLFSHPLITYCFQYFSLCLGGIKIIKQGKFEFFWKSIEMQNNQTFSKKLKELINKMFESKKNNVDLNEIILIENEWFNDIQVNDNDNYMKNSFKQFEEADKNY